MTAPAVRLTGITKGFLGVPVLRGVDLELRAGEVHALMGENGAGKSTLLKVLAGVHRPDSGRIEVGGQVRSFSAPHEAQAAGIAIIHQEFTLLEHRTVAENVYLGREPVRRGQVDRRRMVADTRDLLEWLGEDGIDPTTLVTRLSVAQRQVVEIVKALSTDATVLAMDEPTAALADHEVELLYDLIARLRERGIAILYVSHRMREVFDLSQRITVLKDGAFVHCAPTAELTSDQLVRHMVGRALDGLYPARADRDALGDVRLALRGAGNERVRDVTLDVRAGEIVGIAGLQGSGRSAIARAIWGVEPFTTGVVELDGVPQRIRGPRSAVRKGIAFVTEDRKSEGLALRQSVRDNALLVRRAALRGARARKHTDLTDLLKSVTVVARGEHQEVRYLSGGNQQKVVLAKWLAVAPKVLIVDEPTRGVDVGAKQTVHKLLRDLADSGVAILMISSELPELIGMSDRILVMHEGAIAGELPAGASEEAVMGLATGHEVFA
ncbi:ribose transport system ATP-binding protein [Actinokineospora alba]|uniref:Ribose transport system ATP-binding protein n=1 Tax=Actinokineospora alba TaxID=504798 RepID=A0A1H0NMW9_9PSEU|nr:sugar ABC transporter ATP-binding protein [Actinokineospora alba]TDP68777.1 ribose transport system ATP-binding protein [Actinokineospora alba]SDH86476.1 ribose transport system ATP-binding protein [Actinokineospora alba]SDO94019.1 ribose transport system ATP-binding protein [Actinokineospora alba]